MSRIYDCGSSVQSLDSSDSSDIDGDNINNVTDMGMRSPGALTSGRSVKEIDEQLTNLRKENFNLKLRIYFLEERMGANFNTDKEDAIKKNIELMVELENVRKDVEDKQELLCQAAKAMEIEEEEKRKEISARDQEISKLKEMLEEIECQLQAERMENKEMALCTEAFDLNAEMPNNNSEVIKKLQNTIMELQSELKQERERADQFENIMQVAEGVRVKCETLESEVKEKDVKIYNLSLRLEETNGVVAKYNMQIVALEEQLRKNANDLENANSKLTHSEQDIRHQLEQLKEMKKLLDAMQQVKDKAERKTEKYKMMLTHAENKNIEMVSYSETLKNKIQNLEVRLAAALHEVKRPNTKSEISSAEPRHKSNNTDVALFSVRNLSPVSETANLSKVTSHVNQPYKSPHSTSPVAPHSSSRTNYGSEKHSSETNEIALTSPNDKNITPSEFTSEMQLSPREITELKKNHYKACKIIKTMIQKKREDQKLIDKLNEQVKEQQNEIQCLQEKRFELSGTKVSTPGACKKKSIQEKVCELNLTASMNPAANKEFWLYVMNSIEAIFPYLHDLHSFKQHV